MWADVLMVCEKDSKLKETEISDFSRIFFKDCIKNLPSSKTTDFTYFLNCMIARENLAIFFCMLFFFKVSVAHFTIDFTILESLFS